MLKKQKNIYRRYRLSGFKPDDKVAIDKQRDECYLAIKQSKENYLKNLGNKLIDKKTGPKVYWRIINNPPPPPPPRCNLSDSFVNIHLLTCLSFNKLQKIKIVAESSLQDSIQC